MRLRSLDLPEPLMPEMENVVPSRIEGVNSAKTAPWIMDETPTVWRDGNERGNQTRMKSGGGARWCESCMVMGGMGCTAHEDGPGEGDEKRRGGGGWVPTSTTQQPHESSAPRSKCVKHARAQASTLTAFNRARQQTDAEPSSDFAHTHPPPLQPRFQAAGLDNVRMRSNRLETCTTLASSRRSLSHCRRKAVSGP